MESVLPLKSLNILFLSPMKKDSGNFTTSHRIRCHIQQLGHKCVAFDTNKVQNSDHLSCFLVDNDIEFIIALHAYHAGQLIAGCLDEISRIGYIMILGGTDINVDSHIPERFQIIKRCLLNCRHIVSFTDSMKKTVLDLFSSITADRISVIPQAVQTDPSAFSLRSYLKHERLVPNLDACLVVLVAGIRPVKDPLFITKAFSDWHVLHNHDAFLVIIGPEVDKPYTSKFKEAISSLPGIIYIPGLPLQDTHAAIHESNALVNSSLCEGMSAAILEALSLSCPVVARDIPSNRELVAETHSALFYTTPQELISCLDRVLHCDNTRQKLIQEGQNLVAKYHTFLAEQHAYHQLLQKFLP